MAPISTTKCGPLDEVELALLSNVKGLASQLLQVVIGVQTKSNPHTSISCSTTKGLRKFAEHMHIAARAVRKSTSGALRSVPKLLYVKHYVYRKYLNFAYVNMQRLRGVRVLRGTEMPKPTAY